MSKKVDLAGGMTRAHRGRGRGLRSMVSRPLADPVAVPLSDDSYEIKLTAIESNPNQPRKVFDEQQLRELASSIEVRGVLEPVIVYEKAPGRYVIIAGERRFRASKLAGKESIPCVVRGPDYDRSLISTDQLIENVQRADLEPIEAARALRNLMQEHDLSQVAASKQLGKPRTWVVELSSILRIDPELLDRAHALPKQALIEISRSPEIDHAELIDAVLGVKNPLSEVKKLKGATTPRPRTFHQRTYRLKSWKESSKSSVTVRLETVLPDEDPELTRKVTLRVLGALMKEIAESVHDEPDS